ncbi:lamin tail domain-containing protein [Streptomyces syringium]|uniref:lamin tail domain-containing protein n=1 Tax=Streptomyces syringium TaxID=76729 RepID=UPI0033BC3CE0
MSSAVIARIAATAVACGAVLATAVLPATAATHASPGRATSPVVIGKIQYDSPGADDRSNRSLNAEWVDIVNTGRHAVNLKGWTLKDADRHTYRFGHLRLAAHQKVRVHTGIGRDTVRDVYQNRRAYVWDNKKDTATLRDDHDRVIATASWGYRGR